MRTGPFLKKPVQSMLKKNFRLAWINLQGDESAGSSFAHDPDHAFVHCIEGVGEHNVQVLMTTPDGKLLNALAGYADQDKLLDEMNLALDIHKRIADETLTSKKTLARGVHLEKLEREKKSEGARNKELTKSAQDKKFLADFSGRRKRHDRSFSRNNLLRDARNISTVDMVGNSKTFFGSSNGGSPTNGFIGNSPTGHPINSQIDIEDIKRRALKEMKKNGHLNEFEIDTKPGKGEKSRKIRVSTANGRRII